MSAHRVSFTVALAALGALGLAGGVEAGGVTHTVNIVGGFRFDPAVVMIQAGDTVQWVNVDTMQHNTIGEEPGDPGPPLWSSPDLNNGQTFSRLFGTGETRDYHCGIHPTNMFGRVIVDGTLVQGTMIPVNTSISSSLSFDWYAINFTANRQTGTLRIIVTDPDSQSTTAFQVSGTLGPNSWVSMPFTYVLPGGSPNGTYTVTLEIRTPQGALISSDTDTYNR